MTLHCSARSPGTIVVVAIVLVALIAACAAGPAFAQGDSTRAQAPIDIDKMAARIGQEVRTPPFPFDPGSLNEAGRGAYQRAATEFYTKLSGEYDHRLRVFNWQLLSAKITFVLVVILVTVGIYFSWLQFHAGLKGMEKTGSMGTETTLEASPTGIKVSSPVLGVIILALSLAFFYLYLVHVYPIEEIK
jgi:hypothetical protein